jgi:hypothetical protein
MRVSLPRGYKCGCYPTIGRDSQGFWELELVIAQRQVGPERDMGACSRAQNDGGAITAAHPEWSWRTPATVSSGGMGPEVERTMS